MYSIYTCIGGGGASTAHMTAKTLLIRSYFIHVLYLHMNRGGGGRGGQSTAHMTANTLLIRSYFVHVFNLHMYRGGGGRPQTIWPLKLYL